jgi:hypothetical protein
MLWPSPQRLLLHCTTHLPSSPPRLQLAFSTKAIHHGLLHQTCRGLLHRSGELRVTGELYTTELHTSTSLHSRKQQEDVAPKAHVANVCFKCFRCFSGTLHVFHLDVAKVDPDVAYVSMSIHVCCKRLFQCFICFSRHMLQVFHLNVAYFTMAFKCFQLFCKCFICFGCMLQVFHLDVAK